MNKNNSKKILVTCALPYSNGPIHLGHMLEHIQADIWVRYKKMKNKKVFFICSDDAHGTPVMLKSIELGIKPDLLIKKIYLDHKNDFMKFNINYDNYHTTHSKENKYLLNFIFNKLKKKGFINIKKIPQLFDNKKNIFLPDRFVVGTCPKCNTCNQYGDICESCGIVYNAVDLINPISIISNTKPIIKKEKHFFFNLPLFKKKIFKWINSGVIPKKILNKMKEWFNIGLKEWDISRNSPYFGFEIPNYPGNYFYVWIDATIGYISCFKNLCNKKIDINFNEFWKSNKTTDLYQFIGKDIVYFHSLFWPAILDGINFRKPTKLIVHGHLTINNRKMSKSKSTFITAKKYLKYFDPDYLRYYYAYKLSSNSNDINFNLYDFIDRVNSDLINKVVNLASRNSKFINKYFNNILSNNILDLDIYNIFLKSSKIIEYYYNNRKTNLAMRKIMYLADLANKYTDSKSPWLIVKDINKKKYLQSVCSMAIELFRLIIIYLSPVVPLLVKKTELFLNTSIHWNNIYKPLFSHKINKFKILLNRIDKKNINNLLIDKNINLLK